MWGSGVAAAHAQDTTRTRQDTTAARRDSIAADSARADSVRQAARARQTADSARRAAERADTIRAPLARAPVPALTNIGEPYAWDRDPLTATGALTLGELIDRIPGLTTFRSAWIASPEQTAYMGAFGRIRIFYDGVELLPLDPRNGGIWDLSFIDLWQLDDATVEETPNEIRIHLRSWGVRTHTPLTRVDVYTGDLETTKYRGFYGRRFRRGEALQLGAEQYSTTDIRLGGDADQVSIWGRLGWATDRWKVDASLLRSSRDRQPQAREPEPFELPRLDAVSLISFARVAYRDPSQQGLWAQAIVSSQAYEVRNPPVVIGVDSVPGPGGGGPGGSPTQPDTIVGSADSSRTRPQYTLTGGVTRGPLSLTGIGRLRRTEGQSRFSPGIRLGYERPRLALSLYGERSTSDSVMRVDASARMLPFPWLALRASASRHSPLQSGTQPTSLALRGEVGVRLGRLWVTGGMLTRDTAATLAPIVYDTTFQPAGVGATTGYFATLRGKFWRDVGLDVSGIRYDDAGPYRPQYEVRSQLYLDTDMRERFPSGNLHILIALTHEYRTQALFPAVVGGAARSLESSQFRTWGLNVEIRLLTATLTYQYRNFMGEEYEMVPGYPMPRPINYYGVRWNFAN